MIKFWSFKINFDQFGIKFWSISSNFNRILVNLSQFSSNVDQVSMKFLKESLAEGFFEGFLIYGRSIYANLVLPNELLSQEGASNIVQNHCR